jgi:GT2 family glycosyltransferase
MTKTNSPLKVTAVIPCYNGERFIGPAIEHLLNQTRKADEIIVVEDGSTDRSGEIISGYPEVKVIRHPKNLGLPTGRNNAWKAATGDIIVFVDVDAYAEPDFIEKILAVYEEEDIAGVSGAGFEVRGDSLANRWRQKFLAQNHGPKRVENPPFLFGICASYRRSVLEEIGGFDPAFHTNGEDVEICLRIKKKGYRLVYSPEAKVYHHRNDTIKSLRAMIYRWWFWGHKAHMKNRVPYFFKHLSETWGMMKYITKTALTERQGALLPVNALFFLMAVWAIFAARWSGPPLAPNPERT